MTGVRSRCFQSIKDNYSNNYMHCLFSLNCLSVFIYLFLSSFHVSCNYTSSVGLIRPLSIPQIILCVGGTGTGKNGSIARAERDGTRAETRFRLSPKRTSQFKSVGSSVQSTAGSRGVRISLSNVG